MNNNIALVAKALLRLIVYFAICFAASLLVAFIAYREKNAGKLNITDDLITLLAASAFCVIGIAFMICEAKHKKANANKKLKR